MFITYNPNDKMIWGRGKTAQSSGNDSHYWTENNGNGENPHDFVTIKCTKELYDSVGKAQPPKWIIKDDVACVFHDEVQETFDEAIEVSLELLDDLSNKSNCLTKQILKNQLLIMQSLKEKC